MEYVFIDVLQRYAVIPLSTNSGLIGWVPHCDTLHTLIRDYREKKKILLNIEHRIMLRVSIADPHYVTLFSLSCILCIVLLCRYLIHLYACPLNVQ